jgi:hypothetical protein
MSRSRSTRGFAGAGSSRGSNAWCSGLDDDGDSADVVVTMGVALVHAASASAVTAVIRFVIRVEWCILRAQHKTKTRLRGE